MKYGVYCVTLVLALMGSACSEDTDIPTVPRYTYEPSQVTGSTIMVGHESYEPLEGPESLSPSDLSESLSPSND